jgi:hypothetical protein
LTRIAADDVATWVDMSPSRRRKRLSVPVALACVAIVLLAACSGSKKHATTSTVPSTDAKGNTDVSLAMALGPASIQAAGKFTPFSHTVAAAVQLLVNKYIDAGITKPLFTGAAASGMSASFAPTLASRIGPKGHDLAALSDQGVPVMTAVTSTVKKPLKLVGLEDRSGRLVMVGAGFVLTVKGTTAQGPLTISRVGNFVFEPDTKNVWHISGYDIITRRDNNQTSTSTSAQATTTTVKP